MLSQNNRVKAILSLNRALWGEVFPELRAAKIHCDDKKISLFFYCDGKISEENHEGLQVVGTEVIASFPQHYELDVHILRWDYPKPIPRNEMENIALVYMRKEKKPRKGIFWFFSKR